jgi:hypothetical protein
MIFLKYRLYNVYIICETRPAKIRKTCCCYVRCVGGSLYKSAKLIFNKNPQKTEVNTYMHAAGIFYVFYQLPQLYNRADI